MWAKIELPFLYLFSHTTKFGELVQSFINQQSGVHVKTHRIRGGPDSPYLPRGRSHPWHLATQAEKQAFHFISLCSSKFINRKAKKIFFLVISFLYKKYPKKWQKYKTILFVISFDHFVIQKEQILQSKTGWYTYEMKRKLECCDVLAKTEDKTLICCQTFLQIK